MAALMSSVEPMPTTICFVWSTTALPTRLCMLRIAASRRGMSAPYPMWYDAAIVMAADGCCTHQSSKR